MTTKLFELGWDYYEESDSYLFTHTSKTKKQFEKDVKGLLQKYGKEYLSKERSWVGANNWIRFIAKKLPELGYEPVNPIRYSFFGAYIIDSGDKKWKNIVGEELFTQAVNHNIDIENKSNTRIYGKSKNADL